MHEGVGTTSLIDAVIRAGEIPPDDVPQAAKKRYSEVLSHHLAEEVADGLRNLGFVNTKPYRGGPGEKEFQGGLGPKKVDVSYSDEQHGLILAISIKSMNFAPFGKNLKNRFADLCTEAITLHMRFPYSIVCGLFAMPAKSDHDNTAIRKHSTFMRATRLMATMSGRETYTDPGEKFESFTMMLYQPVNESGITPWIKLVDTRTGREVTEEEYFAMMRELHNMRNPHVMIGEDDEMDDQE